MTTLSELIKAGERHYRTNLLIGRILALLAAGTITGTLLTKNIAQLIFLLAAVAFTSLFVVAIVQYFRLKDHNAKLAKYVPYAEEEKFDETVIRLRDAVNQIDDKSDTELFENTYTEVKEYTTLLSSRIAPLLEKGEKNLTYDERILYTLNQKSLSQLRPSLNKLDKLSMMHDDPEIIESNE